MIEICGAVLAKRSLSKSSIEDQLGDLSIEVIGECVLRHCLQSQGLV